MIFNERIECLPGAKLKELQGERLKKFIANIHAKSPFYQKKMAQLGVSPSDIQTINDIVKLPFTVKDDLRDHYR